MSGKVEWLWHGERSQLASDPPQQFRLVNDLDAELPGFFEFAPRGLSGHEEAGLFGYAVGHPAPPRPPPVKKPRSGKGSAASQ